MATISANTPTVNVSVPVPTPVQSPKKSRPPVSFGDDDLATPTQPTTPQGPRPQRRMTAVILPWSPAPQKMQRLPANKVRLPLPKRVIKYSKG